jgi:hypothetical protein
MKGKLNMGYTHYFQQNRNFTKAEWEIVSADLKAIVDYAQHECGIPLAGGSGEGGTTPEFAGSVISFNGVGDDAHETFIIQRVRVLESYQTPDRLGWSFCKTARKPYDDVVTACLCYLGSVTRRDLNGEPILGTEVFSSSSDGDGSDFLNGLDLARKALPRVANQLDIPMQVMESDRWCAPWVNDTAKGYEVHFCVDGRGYVLKPKTGESYCFESHVALAQFLEGTKRVDFKRSHIVSWHSSYREDYRIEPNIWNAMGSFDKARHARIAKAQAKVLAKLFPVDPACSHQPPAYVRPGEMPDNAGRKFCYSIAELLASLDTKAA